MNLQHTPWKWIVVIKLQHSVNLFAQKIRIERNLEETKPTTIKKQTREQETKMDDYSGARKKVVFLMESERKT